ncbi:ABC transporter ATP-binding protein [Devosia yakushimensis]|uniref:ABC transporter ATP-binding protein n=1 Tax=Devosia yakushimensis TaxID=470028 RepID=A0ABQ5UKN9_9HYPH|nr:ABC transporter ATP-binding protein [Devosia yakushimensis]GLQ11907.1 ABC transporter ATP-binding protein [Devosia yakushimensis]
MPDSHLIVESLTKTYPGSTASSVDHVDFNLQKGEMLALLGPSGCGKTTILRMVAGLIAPTSGRILLEGRDIAQLPVYRRNMGMVFQSYALFPHMNVAENVAFGLEMRGIPKSERAERVERALDLVKLSGYGERRITQLSGGQQQRCAIARSLVIEPDLLLLDEPLSNLDAKLREEMRDEIRDIQARTGVTSIFVTHDQDEALSMADRMAVMSAGRIEQIGTPREVFDRPATEFVAGFIGAGNFFAGTASGNGEADIPGLGRLTFSQSAAAGTPVRLLVRPHRILLGHQGTNHFTGTVEHLVYRGQILTLTVKVGERTIIADLPTHAGKLPVTGETIALSIAPDDVTLIGEAAS